VPDEICEGRFLGGGDLGSAGADAVVFLFDLIGKQDPPAITHPGFYYGFVGAGLAWQLVFFLIARDPARFRPLMIPSVAQKLSYVIPVAVLVMQGRTRRQDLLFVGTDLVWGILFVAAFVAMRGASWKIKKGK
jgi:hypothetical protein